MPDDIVQFINVKTVTAKSGLRAAAKHNLREIQKELGADSRIDATRICLNTVLAGADSAVEVVALANRLKAEAGVTKTRKNCPPAIEILASLPAGSTVDQESFFGATLTWATNYYGLPVLSAAIHRDEGNPHCHILMMPLRDGAMQGRAIVGSMARMYAVQDAFYVAVGHPHGLVRQKPKPRITAATRAKSAEIVLSAIQTDQSLILRPGIAKKLLALIARDPEPMLNELGLSVPHPPKSTKTTAQIFCAPYVPTDQERKAIALSRRKSAIALSPVEKNICLPVYSALPEKPPIPPTHRAETAVLDAADDDFSDPYTRTRDDRPPTGVWSQELGEFVTARHAQDSATRLHGGRTC